MHLTSRSRPLDPTDFIRFDYIIGLPHRICILKQGLILLSLPQRVRISMTRGVLHRHGRHKPAGHPDSSRSLV